MKIYYYDSKPKNFGDQLNLWLWPKLIQKSLLSYSDNFDFIGIGSVIDKRLVNDKRKIIFGAGVRTIDFDLCSSNFDIRFVRGPLSSSDLLDAKYITDAAYCLGLLERPKVSPKAYSYSIFPYFRHCELINWNLFEIYTGIHVIYPFWPIEHIISEIQKSEYILSGAMHGAIIADLFRVPWKRLKLGIHGFESTEFSDYKWNDWCQSMSISEIPCCIISPKYLKSAMYSKMVLKYFLKNMTSIENLNVTILSDQDLLDQKLTELKVEIERLNNDVKI